MGLAELTDPDAVLRAIAECDELGEEEFLHKYGRGRAKGYLLEYEGRLYHSKAIAVAAHEHQTGTKATGNPFSGGKNGAAARLERLGFVIIGPQTPDTWSGGLDAGPAFELLWNSGDYDWLSDGFQGTVTELEETGSSTDTWWTGTRKSGISPGDRLFLFHVGNGLMATAHAAAAIAEEAVLYDNGETNLRPFIPLEWDVILEPRNVLPWGQIRAAIPDFPSHYQGAGQTIEAHLVVPLEELWSKHVARVLAVDGKSTAPTGVAARYKETLVRARLHQRRFRHLLLQHQARKCVVCGITQIQLLEAAHIIPDADGGASDLENGRLMCANHHRAHDAGLFALDEDDTAVWAEDVEPI